MTKALLVIDVQVAMFDESNPVFQGELLLDRLVKYISKARLNRTQIIYIQHNAREGKPLESGKSGWLIHPLITPECNDIIIQKNSPDAFYNTNLQKELDLRGINELIISGIQTEICIDTTCRRAYSLGYNVTLVSDLHSTWDTTSLSASQIIEHHNSILGWFSMVKANDELLIDND